MKQHLTILLITLFSIQLSASEVWIVTPKAISHEKMQDLTEKYKSLLKIADVTSASDTLITHPASESQMSVILDLDSIARSAALNGNFRRARENYLKLASLLKNLPAVSGLEKIMLSTKINLAHMSTMLKINGADSLWQDAHAWAPDATLTSEEFSPAVILRFSKPPKIVKRYQVKIKASEEATLFVDGTRMKPVSQAAKKQYSVFLEPGAHQLSSLAPGMTWTVTNFKVENKVVNLLVNDTPFIAGGCDTPSVAKGELPAKVRLLAVWDDSCSRVYSDGIWYTIEGARLSLPQVVRQAHLSDDLKPGPPPVAVLKTPGEKRSFLGGLIRSPWFWAGVGAVVVGALVISNNQTTTVQTHTVQ